MSVEIDNNPDVGTLPLQFQTPHPPLLLDGFPMQSAQNLPTLDGGAVYQRLSSTVLPDYPAEEMSILKTSNLIGLDLPLKPLENRNIISILFPENQLPVDIHLPKFRQAVNRYFRFESTSEDGLDQSRLFLPSGLFPRVPNESNLGRWLNQLASAIKPFVNIPCAHDREWSDYFKYNCVQGMWHCSSFPFH